MTREGEGREKGGRERERERGRKIPHSDSLGGAQKSQQTVWGGSELLQDLIRMLISHVSWQGIHMYMVSSYAWYALVYLSTSGIRPCVLVYILCELIAVLCVTGVDPHHAWPP